MASYLDQPNHSRGIRNNNPLNLVATSIPWNGKVGNDGVFEKFIDMEHGIRAGAMDIINDYTNGNDTITGLIEERSPRFENATQVIIDYVGAATGIDVNSPFVLTGDVLAVMLKKLIEKEIFVSEYNLITSNLIEDSIFLLPQQILAELGGFVKQNKGGIALAVIAVGVAVWAYKR